MAQPKIKSSAIDLDAVRSSIQPLILADIGLTYTTTTGQLSIVPQKTTLGTVIPGAILIKAADTTPAISGGTILGRGGAIRLFSGAGTGSDAGGGGLDGNVLVGIGARAADFPPIGNISGQGIFWVKSRRMVLDSQSGVEDQDGYLFATKPRTAVVAGGTVTIIGPSYGNTSQTTYKATADITVVVDTTGGAGGGTAHVYNDSASAITITPDAGLTMYGLAAATGTRTLAARGMCTITAVSDTELKITGEIT